MTGQIDSDTSTEAALGSEQQFDQKIADLVTKDAQVRAAAPDREVAATLFKPGLRLGQIVANVMEGYADRPAVGERARELVKDPKTGRSALRLLPSFKTVTYRELWADATALANALHTGGERPLRAGDFVMTLGFTSVDYAVVDLAVIRLGATVVPMQAGGAIAQLRAVMEETAPVLLATSIEALAEAVESVLEGHHPVKLLVFDYYHEDDDQRETVRAARERLRETGSPVVLTTLADEIAQGTYLPEVPVSTVGDEESLALLIYTSGSTGSPKGAMYPQRLVASTWANEEGALTASTLPTIAFNYTPMNHSLGRASLASTLANGGTTYFASKSDLSTLFDDIALVRPTMLVLVPRICDMVFQRYQSDLAKRLASGEAEDEAAEAARTELRDGLFGGRVLRAICGSAPLSSAMRSFMDATLGIELIDGYASTETCGAVIMNTRILRPPVTEYKLVDVPELGYFTTDQPHPRGELWLKCTYLFPGYFKRPEATAEVFSEDGFYKTGDIMAETEPDRLVYLDRSKNVLKLSQGEFVAVSKLEAVFGSSPYVSQIFVYGNSERSYLLAVVVPAEGALERAGEDPAALKQLLIESLQKIVREEGLNSWESPRDILVETTPFSKENGLLSSAAKALRPKLKEHYGERLEALYSEHADGQESVLRELRRNGADGPTGETVVRAVAALLGVAPAGISPKAHYLDLGGDSLTALSLSNLLADIFSVEVPVGTILSVANDLQGIAGYIDAQRSGANQPTFTSVHGAGATEIHASDLTLDKFIDAETLAAAPSSPHPTGLPKTVLITGANGWLGRFLTLELLERLDERDGRLIAIVRGTDDEAAYKRFESVFDNYNPELFAHFKDLASRRLTVIAGDVGEAGLGLDDATYSKLAEEVDFIVHLAALVNHVLPYSQLFAPNVVGTAEVIRLALTTRIKPITNLSTGAVAAYVAPDEFEEDGDIRVFSPTRPVRDEYINGYANSKWAGEVLLREANDLAGMPFTTLRSDMILSHTRYAGQLNLSDRFTRQILSIVATGLAPKSFYELDAKGERQLSHYPGVPVDFTAEAVTTLGEQQTEGFRSYNMVNANADGISLDTFVDWLIEDGHKITVIDDYDEWLARFSSAVKSLPEHQKQNSMLPLLDSLSQPEPAHNDSPLPADVFRAAVQAAGIGAEKDIPHLQRELISKYVSDLKLRGLL